MSSAEPRRTRPRRSRAGLVGFLVVLLLVVWQVVGWIQPRLVKVTPAKFLAGAWAVASGEAVTGKGPLDDELAYHDTPYVMYSLKPNWTRGGEPRRTSNSHGFRGPEIELPKPAGRTRILCLGGSTTYSFAVDDEHTYPYLLEQDLRGRQLDVDVVNGGVESYTTAESLANLAHRGLELEPDLVVIYHAPNDVRPRRYANFAPDYSHYRKPWNGTTAGYEPLGGEFSGINQFIQYFPPDTDLTVPELLARNPPTAYRRNLVSLIGVARAHGVEPVLVTFAGHPEPDDAGLAAGIREHNVVLREVAAAQGAHLIDLAASFPADPALFADDIHLLDEGCARKAALIAEGLLPLLQ